MLHYNALEPRTLGLLNKIKDFAQDRNFVLVGGTALALHIGHRYSVYLDFFNKNISELLALKSLVYFTDAEGDADPGIVEKTTWNEIKSFIINTVESYSGRT